ncbi:diguanylate cyclase [Gynuella sunshinyii]|uniref:diguanylate cyclase n=1 Tax=Gynuella sunshinyii YC6258 TaxID=1445510 RepID=A0A0C5VM98_9GAMM|nr:diguanylate cyclase [Gynuella sunshinyii]AJQ95436.1 response regulator containing a CheY-like receiver domain and a GGDEF domain [Gynuella sunshinyii YC6258]
MLKSFSHRSREVSDAWVLIVDDEPINCLVLEEILADICHTRAVNSGAEAIDACVKNKPDLILMDVMMPDQNGLEICRELKADPELMDIPVIFVTSLTNDDDQDECWNAGGTDFVTKPVNATTVRNRVKTHLAYKLQTDMLMHFTYVDGLTGAYNRRFLDAALPRCYKQARRTGSPFSLIMFDIDYFKKFNDRYGHLIGDDCLKQISATSIDTLKRPTDMFVRYGGEEFLCILPDTDEQGAKHLADELKRAIRVLNIIHEDSNFGHVTVSIGVFTLHQSDSDDTQAILQTVDAALYQAKRSGRNRICVAGQESA